MLRNMIGTMAKGAMLGVIVIGAKKLWERQHVQPMKEPLVGSNYNDTATTFADTPALTVETATLDAETIIDIDHEESPALTKPLR